MTKNCYTLGRAEGLGTYRPPFWQWHYGMCTSIHRLTQYRETTKQARQCALKLLWGFRGFIVC